MAKKEVEETKYSEKLKKHVSGKKFFLFLFLIIIVAVVVMISPYITFKYDDTLKLEKCLDGTFNGSCSFDSSYYCDNGVLIEKASVCGCPDFMNKQGDSCNSVYEKNPSDLNLNYVLNGQGRTLNYTLYKGVYNYVSNLPRTINYGEGEKASRSDFHLMNIDEEVQKNYVFPLVAKIMNQAETKEDSVRIAISLVQNLPFGLSDKKENFNGAELNYSRYAYEVLYDNKGVCGERVALLSLMLKEMGYGTALIYFPDENHEALGIKCPVKHSYDNTGYCFVETSGHAIISDSNLMFSNGIKLSDNYQIFLLSKGESLSEDMQEYNDANFVSKTKEFGVNFLTKNRFSKLKHKYGLDGEYEL